MSNLHDGTCSCQAAAADCQYTASIFINPLQFEKVKTEQLPRSLECDTSLLSETGCDLLSLPITEMYGIGAR